MAEAQDKLLQERRRLENLLNEKYKGGGCGTETYYTWVRDRCPVSEQINYLKKDLKDYK